MTSNTRKAAPVSEGRIMLGAFAGIAGTAAMNTAMRLMHRRLPPHERYSLPPRELTAAIRVAVRAGELPDDAEARQAMIAHFLYGAAAGAIYAELDSRPSVARGAGYGVLVWAASYLGWIPAARLLEPATRHPRERNLMMIAAHLVWGAVMAGALREAVAAERQGFAGRRHDDRAEEEGGPASS